MTRARQAGPRLAILFWFYKEPEVCRDRLRLLRRLNPGVPIYGLWGGDPGATEPLRLRRHLDDLYMFPEPRSAEWKWRHGDRLLAAWARERGSTLPRWDTVVVVQWDMLLLAPIHQLFHMLRRDEALFSGLRPFSEVEAWWGWARCDDPEKQADLDRFRSRIAQTYGYEGPLMACLFIVACLPRRFLELYAASGPPIDGFLEYKVPTLACIFDIPFCTQHPFQPWWASEPETRDAPLRRRMLNAVRHLIPREAVLREIVADDGARVIHPYERRFPWWLTVRPLARLALRLSARCEARP